MDVDQASQCGFGAVALEPRPVDRGSRVQQRQLAREQIILADLPDLVATLVERVECVVHGRVGRRVLERDGGGIVIEKGRRGRRGHVLARFQVLALGDRGVE